MQDIFVGEGGGGGLFYCRETLWLIGHDSDGEGVGGGCTPSHAAHSAEAYLFDCQIYIVDQ